MQLHGVVILIIRSHRVNGVGIITLQCRSLISQLHFRYGLDIKQSWRYRLLLYGSSVTCNFFCLPWCARIGCHRSPKTWQSDLLSAACIHLLCWILINIDQYRSGFSQNQWNLLIFALPYQMSSTILKCVKYWHHLFWDTTSLKNHHK